MANRAFKITENPRATKRQATLPFPVVSSSRPVSQSKKSRLPLVLQKKKPRYAKVDMDEAYNTWRECLTPGMRTAIEAVEGGAPITKDLLLKIGGILSGPGWYAAIVIDDNDDDYFKAYVGQSADTSVNVQQRISTKRRDPTTCPAANKLLYHIWRKPGRRAVFVHLGRHRGFMKGNKEHNLMMKVGRPPQPQLQSSSQG